MSSSDFDLEDDFYKTLVDGKSFKKVIDKEGEYTSVLDPKQSYRANTYGYRSDEFSSGVSLLAAGCSFTFGIGVPEDAIWSNVLSKKLGLSVANISRPGASVPWIVETVFTYFEKFGHPEYLLCLFPDETRAMAIVDGKIVTGPKKYQENKNGIYGTRGVDDKQYVYDFRVKTFEEFLASPSYIKRPYEASSTYTQEYATYHSIRAIRRLEQYCKLAGIKLAWSTWDSSFNDLLIKIDKEKDLKFDNFFELGVSFYKKQENGMFKDAIFHNEEDLANCARDHNDEAKIACSCYLDCHSELIELYGSANFHTGTDAWHGDIFSHPGAHLQAHFAEKFIDRVRGFGG
jgi:hypothetical protein